MTGKRSTGCGLSRCSIFVVVMMGLGNWRRMAAAVVKGPLRKDLSNEFICTNSN
jgi:hypothetical protein